MCTAKKRCFIKGMNYERLKTMKEELTPTNLVLWEVERTIELVDGEFLCGALKK